VLRAQKLGRTTYGHRSEAALGQFLQKGDLVLSAVSDGPLQSPLASAYDGLQLPGKRHTSTRATPRCQHDAEGHLRTQNFLDSLSNPVEISTAPVQFTHSAVEKARASLSLLPALLLRANPDRLHELSRIDFQGCCKVKNCVECGLRLGKFHLSDERAAQI